MEINKEDERPEVVMAAQDKDAINSFSRKLARKNELKVLIERRQKLAQLHEDASDELMLMDDDVPVHYTIGDVFILDDKDQVESNLEATKAELAKDIQEYEEEIRTVSNDMTKLKATLYAKFGKVCDRPLLFLLLLLRYRPPSNRLLRNMSNHTIHAYLAWLILDVFSFFFAPRTDNKLRGVTMPLLQLRLLSTITCERRKF